MTRRDAAEEYHLVRYGAIEVLYTQELNGGGNTFGQDYVRLVATYFGRVNRLCEWCCGPGFIGFSLLAHGLCRELCLLDVNPVAVDACRRTIVRNGLEGTVKARISDCLDSVPSDEAWDLVIGNPPHSGTNELHPDWGPAIIYMDVDWALHRRFYRDVRPFMREDGAVVLQENRRLSSPETFRQMIQAGGLRLICSVPCQGDPSKYYIWCKR